MNRNKKLASGVNVGSSSILVTFVLLCLITFAALSYVSANSDYKLSKQVANRTSRYYETTYIADVYVSNVESKVRSIYKNSESEEDFYTNLASAFENNKTVIYEKRDDNTLSFSYSLNITEKQILEVTLTTSYTEFSTRNTLDIEKWQTVSTYSEEETSIQDNNNKLLF